MHKPEDPKKFIIPSVNQLKQDSRQKAIKTQTIIFLLKHTYLNADSNVFGYLSPRLAP